MSYSSLHALNFWRKMATNVAVLLSPLYFMKLGFTGWHNGLIISCLAGAPLLSSFPIGWINDRYSIRRIIEISLLALTFIYLAISQVRNPYLMAGLYLFFGVATNALDVSTNTLYYKEERQSNLSRRYSRLVFWQYLGMATGVLLGGIVSQVTDYQTLFMVLAGTLPLGLVLVRRLDREKFAAVSFSDYRRSFLRPEALLFSLMLFVLGLHWGVEGTVYSPFLRTYFRLDDFHLALYIALPLYALAAAAFSVGWIKADMETVWKIFSLSLLLSGGGLALQVNRNIGISFFFRVVHEIGDGLIGALMVLHISQLFARREIGGSSGLMMAMTTLGQMVGAMIFAPLGYSVGFQIPFFIAGSFLLADAAFVYLILRRRGHIAGPSSSAGARSPS